MGLPAEKEDRFYTYADYLTWPGDERWELIDGAAYSMSPAPGRRHQRITGAVFSELYQFLKDKPCEVYSAPFDLRLAAEKDPQNDQIVNVVQPDISVYCRDDQLDDAGAIAAPDIAVEVLSPSTSVKDQREKLALYERFGVREYWIIDPANQTLAVYTLPVKRNGKVSRDAGYGKPLVYGPEDTLTSRILKGFQLPLEIIFPVETGNPI